ncbi:hypothetical protein SEA_LOZINAK_53 [Gordonia phage Lozinak]|uniref:Uncharacterized protein n=5 Tax=Smoothievirus TaxID=1982557 RepID=A0A2D1GFP6_9CAUD|nr:hypothetical protein BEN60_gp153 [Gordonia phage Smoothie]YP_009273087.1 hypothetical protein BH768_gp155 [Gordonia phage ClubL]YP_009276165.1 hypothetical protein BH772_gp157 [Gordonia phage Bachita]YP_009281208.1 membrane protein [Gordonia phage Cucurbita]ATN90679.1 hypothetical protein SEA_LOZINAK_53 [Gordonia phage Lozinak]AUE23621.1 hypothetical protein SEA_TONIANN_52 [Gordonia phage Toniann]QAU06561.1 hypothetical protein SEA_WILLIAMBOONE_52 [Gordonia phage WilliamBoone]QAU06917.1 h
MSAWTPDAWNDVGIVAFLILGVGLLALCFIRGWLVLGPSHKEIVAEKDRALTHANELVGKLTEVSAIQAQTIAENSARAQVTDHVLQSIRDVYEDRMRET